MDVTDSLRKHFDLPPRKKAADATRLDAFLDNPGKFNYDKFKADSMTRSVDFGYSGDIPPCREDIPNRFHSGARVIEKSEDAYFVVEPGRLKIDAASRTLPTRPKTPPSTKINQDTSLLIGLRASEYNYVQNMVNDNSDKPYKWDGETLMNPDRRRLSNKIDCEVERKRKRNKLFQDIIVKSENLLSRTHPRGVLGIDTPYSEQTIRYKDKQKKMHSQTQQKRAYKNTRTEMLSEKAHVGSKLLYHCPTEYQHPLKTHGEWQHKRRVQGPAENKRAKERISKKKTHHSF